MRRVGPRFRFRPFSAQQKRLLTWWMPQSPYRDYDMVIADGSVRSGKTIAMIDGFLTWVLSTFENEDFILAGRSVGALKRNVLNPMFKILRAKGIAYHYVRSGPDTRIEIGTNTFYCFGANNEASQDVLQGLTAAGGLGDEVALFPWSFIEQMIARCSVDGSKLWFNCNPEGPNHKVKTDLIDQAEEKRILHLHFVLDDNLTLSEKIKSRYKRLFSGLWYKRYILGLWVLAEGVIYDMFDASPGSKHVTSDLPKIREWYMGIDYGTAGSAFVALLLGIGEDNRLYFAREWRWDSVKKQRRLSDLQYSKRLKTWLTSLESQLGKVEPRRIYVDPSAASFIVQLYDDGWEGVTKANNDVVPGIRFFGNLISADRWRIHELCSGTITEMQEYVWDPKAQDRGEDKPLKQKDHGPDAGRYGVMGTRRITRHWINEELDQAA
ncbi:MAG: PBSX family phage terminase large subunit [Actinobacteria bacterium]|nr:PBSX family phage terminase large subunit [Actinomycetota bacterium]